MHTAYLFDLDGTLVDTAPDLAGAVNHALAAFDCSPVPTEEVRQWVGQGAKVMLAKAFTAAGYDEAPAEALSLLLEYYEQNIADLSRPYPGVVETLAILHKAGNPLAVVTNKYRHLAVSLLEALQLASLFVTIIGGKCASRPKPHPDPILLACERLTVAPKDAIMVGDSHYDEEAALAAGVAYRQVTYGYADQNNLPIDRPPPVYIASFSELP